MSNSATGKIVSLGNSCVAVGDVIEWDSPYNECGDGAYYVCTAPAGHEPAVHIAQDAANEVIAVWAAR